MKAYDEIVDFLAAGTTSDGLLLFRPSKESALRVSELLQLEKNGGITSAEKVELDDYLHLEHLMRLTKARARKYVKS